MRHLNIKQKKILRDWFNEGSFYVSIGFDVEKDLPFRVWKKIEEINDYETIYQDINRYVRDLVSKGIEKVNKRYRKGGKKKDTRNRCPICQTIIPDSWRTCKSCGDVLKGNPWLCVTDLM